MSNPAWPSEPPATEEEAWEWGETVWFYYFGRYQRYDPDEHAPANQDDFNLIKGTDDDETIDGTDEKDKIYSYSGNDVVNAYAGDDVVHADNGDDVVYGGSGDDSLNGGSGSDKLYGGVGDDTLNGNSYHDYLYGGVGDDTLDGSYGEDFLYGGAGDDTLAGGPESDTFVYATRGFGKDVITDFDAREDKLDFRGSGLGVSDLNLSWGNGGAIVEAGAGDRIELKSPSGLGSDPFGDLRSTFLLGPAPTSPQAEVVSNDAPPVVEPPQSQAVPANAESEQERLPLGADDTSSRSNGASGDGSHATVAGTMAADVMVGETGADVINARGGDDTVRGRGGDDRLWGGMGDDTLHGNAGDDHLYGGRGKDVLYGGFDNDRLYGGKGGDTLYGGNNGDHLEGGRGDDVLFGGAGRDKFVYGDDNFGRDRIGDFKDGVDLLDFRGSGLQWNDLEVSSNGKGHAVVRIEGGDGRIMLEGVDASFIDQNDFIF